MVMQHRFGMSKLLTPVAALQRPSRSNKSAVYGCKASEHAIELCTIADTTLGLQTCQLMVRDYLLVWRAFHVDVKDSDPLMDNVGPRFSEA
jgi:hypothetical protein